MMPAAIPPAVLYSPLFGLTLTVAFYAVGLALRRVIRWLHPLLVTCAGTLLVLWLLGLDVGQMPLNGYRVGGDILTLLLGPATVALAVPLYKNRERLQAALWPVLAGVLVGAIVALATGAGFVLLAHGSQEVMLSLMPKSTTTPISMELSRLMGGLPDLTAAITVFTGFLGSMFGPTFLRLVGIRHPVAVGVAMGTAAHGIGTARLLEDDSLTGSFSAVAMALCGLITTLLLIPWLHR